MTYPLFLLILATIVGIAMLIEYKVIIPSVMAFRNKQEYEHKNLLKKDLQEIKDKLNSIEKRIGG
jgi:predicted transcriptional regulator